MWRFCLERFSKQGSTPTPWARGLRDQIQKWALPDPENPLFLGFSVLRGGLRPWSQTMVSEGARPWGRGRSGDCERLRPTGQLWKLIALLCTSSAGRCCPFCSSAPALCIKFRFRVLTGRPNGITDREK